MFTLRTSIAFGTIFLIGVIGGGLFNKFNSRHNDTRNNYGTSIVIKNEHDRNNALDKNITLVSGISAISFRRASTSCEDSYKKTLIRSKLRRCRWIGINFPEACDKFVEARQNCPVTCNACADVCLDVSKEFIVAGQNVTCDVRSCKENYCGYPEFASYCPVSCDSCTSSATASPSSSPTTLQPSSFTKFPSRIPSSVTLKSSPPTPLPTFSMSSNSSQVTNKNWKLVGNFIYGGLGDNAGLAVSLSRDGLTVFIGEPGAGLVRSFTQNINRLQPKGFTIGNSYDPWFGSSIASSLDGSVVAVSSYKYDNYRGIVRVYVWDGLKWIKLANDLLGDKEGDWFGWDVDISEDGRSIIVGVHLQDSSHGYARVFDINASGWKKRQKDLCSNMPVAFGFSVTISGNGTVAAIGAPKGAYTEVYQWDSDRWSLLGNRIQGSPGSQFGNSVAVSNKYGLVVAVGANRVNSGRGAVYLYEWRHITSEWQLRGNDAVTYGNDSRDSLGGRVSISEDGNTVAYDTREKVGVSVWDGIVWREQGFIKIGGPVSMSLSGDGNTLAIGMPHDNTIAFRSGATAIFKWH